MIGSVVLEKKIFEKVYTNGRRRRRRRRTQSDCNSSHRPVGLGELKKGNNSYKTQWIFLKFSSMGRSHHFTHFSWNNWSAIFYRLSVSAIFKTYFAKIER